VVFGGVGGFFYLDTIKKQKKKPKNNKKTRKTKKNKQNKAKKKNQFFGEGILLRSVQAVRGVQVPNGVEPEGNDPDGLRVGGRARRGDTGVKGRALHSD
jgi:hypothetical protein